MDIDHEVMKKVLGEGFWKSSPDYLRIPNKNVLEVPKDRQKSPIIIKIGQEVNKKPIKTGKIRVYYYVTVEDKLISYK